MNEVRVGVVGGSIAGCMAAGALQRGGFHVVVLERSPQPLEVRGSGISLPRTVIERMKKLGLLDESFVGPSAISREWRIPSNGERYGRLAFKEPMSGIEMQHWGALFNSLRRRIGDDNYVMNATVVDARDTRDGVTLSCADGASWEFDLVVGADGYRSTIRRVLAPKAEPVYAGYSAWRGILPEAAVEDADFVDGVIQMVGVPRGHMGVYLVPGQDGDPRPGKRSVNWLIYDGAAPGDIARVTRTDDGTLVGETIAPGGLDAEQLSYLHNLAVEHLPPWFRDLFVATPAPYLQSLHDLPLERFVSGRLCLIGDAATIARPHTGSGASKAALDALALADALSSSPSIDEALAAYNEERVPAGNALVKLGQELGRDQVVDAPDWQHLDKEGFERLLIRGPGSRTYFGGPGTKSHSGTT